MKASGAKTAVIAGGGFIGLEVAENLLEQGLDVTVMDMAPQVMPGFDPEFAAYGTRHLEKGRHPRFHLHKNGRYHRQ